MTGNSPSEIPQHLSGGVYPNKHDIESAEEAAYNTTHAKEPKIGRVRKKFFRNVLTTLNETGITYAVGSAFARFIYTRVWRETKDLDIFLLPESLKPAMEALSAKGYEVNVEYRHWLAKAKQGDDFVDLIFGTGHGNYRVTPESFEGSPEAVIVGVPTHLFPIEELITSDMYVSERGRFDGPEVMHLILGRKGQIDWQRILTRLGDNWELLLWHLILFDFVYPGHSDYLPKELMVELFDRVRQRWSQPNGNHKSFRGSILDPFSFTVDIEDWGYQDRRKLKPLVDKRGDVL